MSGIGGNEPTWFAPGIIEPWKLEEGDCAMPVKYTDELRTRAIELVIDAQADPERANGAITRVASRARTQ